MIYVRYIFLFENKHISYVAFSYLQKRPVIKLFLKKSGVNRCGEVGMCAYAEVGMCEGAEVGMCSGAKVGMFSGAEVCRCRGGHVFG